MAIAYKISTEQPEKVVLTPETKSQGCLLIPFALLGLLMFVYGLFSLGTTFANSQSLHISVYLFISIGGIFLAVAGILRSGYSLAVHQLIFDNAQGKVIVCKGPDSEDYAEIPYEEIERFGIRHELEDRGQSSRQSRITYAVYWLKKDGSIWDIKEKRGLEDAKKTLALLQEAVKLDKTSPKVQSAKVPSRIQIDRIGETTSVEWQNSYPAKNTFYLWILACIGFLGYGSYANGVFDDSMEEIVVLVVMAILFAVVATGYLLYVLKGVLLRWRVEMDKEKVAVFGMLDKRKVGLREINIKDVVSITFDVKSSEGGSAIRMLNQAQLNAQKRALENDREAVEALRDERIVRLNTDDLDLVDKINLELVLQRILVEKTKQNIL